MEAYACNFRPVLSAYNLVLCTLRSDTHAQSTIFNRKFSQKSVCISIFLASSSATRCGSPAPFFHFFVLGVAPPVANATYVILKTLISGNTADWPSQVSALVSNFNNSGVFPGFWIAPYGQTAVPTLCDLLIPYRALCFTMGLYTRLLFQVSNTNVTRRNSYMYHIGITVEANMEALLNDLANKVNAKSAALLTNQKDDAEDNIVKTAKSLISTVYNYTLPGAHFRCFPRASFFGFRFSAGSFGLIGEKCMVDVLLIFPFRFLSAGNPASADIVRIVKLLSDLDPDFVYFQLDATSARTFIDTVRPPPPPPPPTTATTTFRSKTWLRSARWGGEPLNFSFNDRFSAFR